MSKLKKISISGILLAIAMLLPMLTFQIPRIGNMLCPMHIPILLCGFICGWPYAMIIGFIAPIMRFFIFGMPPIFPTGLAMMFELAAYGFFTGYLYKKFFKKPFGVYTSLISAMILGRFVWGIAMYLISAFTMVKFNLSVFVTAGFINAIPGIIVQIILIPVLVLSLKKVKGIAI